MRLYKKFLAAALCCFMLLSGCGGGEGDEVTGDVDVLEDADTTDETEEEEEPVEITKVGFIYNGTVGADTLAAIYERSRYEVERTLGVETCYMQNVLLQQFDDAVSKLVNVEGCDVIVSASNHYSGRISSVAKEYPNIDFISLGGFDQATNLSSIQPMIYQAVNVCGLVAAYNTVSNKVGIVADMNLFHSYAVVDAFALGVKELKNADVETSLNWALSDSFNDTKKAIDDLVAKGNDIIFLYQAAEYGIRYCNSIGVKVIGFAYNVPEIAPDTYLTGYYLNLNSYMINQVRKAQWGTFAGTLNRNGLKHGTVGMIKLNEEICKEGTSTITQTLYEYVSEGKSVVFHGEVRDTEERIRIEKGATLNVPAIFMIDWLAEVVKNVNNMSLPRSEDDLFYSDLAIYS